MKKLMFIAALIAAGLAQAASLDWSISPKSFLMPDDSKPNGATVYLFDTAAEGYSTFASDLAGGKLGDSISADTFTGAKGYLGSGTTYSSTKASQLNVNYGKASGTVTVGSVGDYNLAMIVYDNGKYMISGVTSGTSYADNPDDGAAAGFTAGIISSGSSWATYTPSGSQGDIPEPTSGLLLLVGAGMLALRRKQK